MFNLLLIAALLLLLWCLSLRSEARPEELAPFRRFRYAHRGLHDSSIPENSLAAFQRAAALGFGIELDVHLSRDGRLPIFHDSDLMRMTGVDGTLEDRTAEELSQLRLKNTEHTIPLLDDVLPLFVGKAPVILELKAHNGNGAVLAETVCRLLEQFPDLQFCLESFDPRPICWLRKHRPDLLRGQLAQRFPLSGSLPRRFALLCMRGMPLNFLTRPNFVAYRHTHRRSPSLRLCLRLWKVQEISWTVTSIAELQALEAAGSIVIFEGFCPTSAEAALP